MEYKEQLIKQKKELDSLINDTEKRLKANKVTDTGIIFYSKRKNGYQYYLKDKAGKKTYVKHKNLDIIRKKAQKEYDEAVHKTLIVLRSRLQRFIKNFDIGMIEREYEHLSEAKRLLVNPIIESDEAFIEKWERENPGNMNSFPVEGQYLTDRGEHVRSKSEKILADLFYKKKIPYSYEPRFELSNGSSVYPDFVLLNVSKRKTIYWEHFGLISDGEYAEKALRKMDMYEKNGICIGEDLLFSMEAEDSPLDIKQIEAKIKRYLLT